MTTVNKQRKMELELDIEIAKFMGWALDNSFPDKGRVWRKGNTVELDTTFKFSTDWNVLMEVFEEINKIDGYFIEITINDCAIFKNSQMKFYAQTIENTDMKTIEAVYTCIGEFVKHYNESKIDK